MVINASYAEGRYSGIRIEGDVSNDLFQGLMLNGENNIPLWLCDYRTFDERGNSIVPYAIAALNGTSLETAARVKLRIRELVLEVLDFNFSCPNNAKKRCPLIDLV